MKQKKIGLALGGGGAKGLCHIAFLKAFDELGIKPDIIAGTSIGAIIGGGYAAGVSGREMEELLNRLRLRDISKLMDFSIRKNPAMLKGKGVENFLYRNIPVRTFEELKIPLKVVATNFWKRQEIIFETGDLIQAIRASMSMPAIFKPVKINDIVLIDGGAVNPLPYDIIRDQCDILIAIDVSGAKTPRNHNTIPTMLESIMSTFQIMQASIVQNKMRISTPDIYIKPELKNIRVLNFDRFNEIINGVKADVELFKSELTTKLTAPVPGKNKKKRRFFFIPRYLYQT